MVYFLIGVPKIKGNVNESMGKVTSAVDNAGQVYKFDLELNR
jgi:hypothetical protein